MDPYFAACLAAVSTMVALDLLWLGVVAKPMYQQAIGHLMADQPKVSAALVCYALYALGLLVFAVAPQAESPAWSRTVFMGALFGFFACATDDLTNLATLRGWPIRLTLIDMVWGTVLSVSRRRPARRPCTGQARRDRPRTGMKAMSVTEAWVNRPSTLQMCAGRSTLNIAALSAGGLNAAFVW